MSILYLIDDDDDFREYLKVIIESLEINVIPFSNTLDFFNKYPILNNFCYSGFTNQLRPIL